MNNYSEIGAIFSLEELESMPTLCISQSDDLKVDNGAFRFWLCRCGVDDGMESDNIVTVEKFINGYWKEYYKYIAK